MLQVSAYLDVTAQKKRKLRKNTMFFKSKVEEVLYVSSKDVEKYLIKIITKNLGLSTIVVDYRFLQEIHTHWKKVNPLLQELHFNKGTTQDRKNEKSMKLFQDEDTTQILRKLRTLASLKNPVQYHYLHCLKIFYLLRQMHC